MVFFILQQKCSQETQWIRRPVIRKKNHEFDILLYIVDISYYTIKLRLSSQINKYFLICNVFECIRAQQILINNNQLHLCQKKNPKQSNLVFNTIDGECGYSELW